MRQYRDLLNYSEVFEELKEVKLTWIIVQLYRARSANDFHPSEISEVLGVHSVDVCLSLSHVPKIISVFFLLTKTSFVVLSLWNLYVTSIWPPRNISQDESVKCFLKIILKIQKNPSCKVSTNYLAKKKHFSLQLIPPPFFGYPTEVIVLIDSKWVYRHMSLLVRFHNVSDDTIRTSLKTSDLLFSLQIWILTVVCHKK